MIYGLAACGEVDSPITPDGPPDASPPDAPTPDASFPTGPFGNPQLVVALANNAQDDDPTLTDDMLEIYFASTRTTGQDGNGDIWRATRANVKDAWNAPVRVTELSSDNSNDDNPGISGDGLTIWFSSNRGSNVDIYVSTRTDRLQTWKPPILVSELSTPVEDLGAEPGRSQQRIALYGDSPRRLFEATIKTPGHPPSWNTPTPIDSLNDIGTNLSGFFVTDLELWFSSTRPGGPGGQDIYRAQRTSLDAPFGTPTLVEGINSAARDDDPWLSPDGHTLYFTRTVTVSGVDNQEIYLAERP